MLYWCCYHVHWENCNLYPGRGQVQQYIKRNNNKGRVVQPGQRLLTATVKSMERLVVTKKGVCCSGNYFSKFTRCFNTFPTTVHGQNPYYILTHPIPSFQEARHIRELGRIRSEELWEMWPVSSVIMFVIVIIVLLIVGKLYTKTFTHFFKLLSAIRS